MKLRYSTPSLKHLEQNIIVHQSGLSAGFFGPESNHSVWHQNVLHTFLLIIGVAAVASTLLLGSFLWGLVSRKNKKQRDRPTLFSELYLDTNHTQNSVIALHEFTNPAPSPPRYVPDRDRKPTESKTTLYDSFVFDSGQDYAQVLAEARLHAAATQRTLISTPSRKAPAKQSSDKSKHRWLTRSSSARTHNRFSDVEAVFPMDDPRSKSSKSWKRLLFWKKSRKSSRFEFSPKKCSHSNSNTPLHNLFKSSKTRAAVSPATPTHSTRHRPERARSGPLYSDGSTYTYERSGRPSSGPLSSSATPIRDGVIGSPYYPLKKPATTTKVSSGPLYVP